jgi:energy-converting hydrogenase Eha subunit H
VVLLEPSFLGSASIVIACAGQMASHNLQAMQRSSPKTSVTFKILKVAVYQKDIYEERVHL